MATDEGTEDTITIETLDAGWPSVETVTRYNWSADNGPIVEAEQLYGTATARGGRVRLRWATITESGEEISVDARGDLLRKDGQPSQAASRGSTGVPYDVEVTIARAHRARRLRDQAGD